jgi:cobalt-zinc-cadmium efflux system outer membrane protein
MAQTAVEARVPRIMELSYADASALFIKESLPLVAASYDVQVAEADLMQARLWNNPHFNWNQDLYSVERNEYFNQNNQRLIQIDQLFSIAGKHTRSVKLAKINVDLNRLIYQDVRRSLQYELGNLYYSLQGLQESAELYKMVYEQFRTLIDAYEVQFRVGAIPGNELTRLKGELLAIQTEIINNQNEANSVMSDLRTLLNLRPEVTISTTEPLRVVSEGSVAYAELLERARKSRPDYLLRQREVDYHEMDLKLQRSTAVPDVLLGYQPHDKGSNYVRPYTGLVLEFDLPLFNRNQGAIQAAKTRIAKAQVEQSYGDMSLENELSTSIYQLLNTNRALANYSNSFLDELKRTNDRARENFNNKNISMLEYIDVQRTYVQTMHEYIALKSQSMLNVQELNFTVGAEVF